MTTTRAPAPPEVEQARRDAAAARRHLRSLTAKLDKAGGVDLFAGDPASVTTRIREAQAAADQAADRVAELRGPRGNLRLLAPTAPAASTIGMPAAEQDEPPAIDVPAAASAYHAWQAAVALASSRNRPHGPEPLKADLVAEMTASAARLEGMSVSRRSVPAAMRDAFDAPMATCQAHQLDLLGQLRALESPSHPASVALRAWEERHGDVDAQVHQARAELDRVVTAQAQQTHVAGLVPELPVNVSEQGRAMWVEAVGAQLAYREDYAVRDATPLGVCPWDPVQRAAWDDAREVLATVGVHIPMPVHELGAQEQQHSRRSLNQALLRAV